MPEQLQWSHQAFDNILKMLEETGRSKVSRERIADVLTRLMIASPDWPSQTQIAQGEMLPLPYRIAPDSVSRTVAILAADEIGLVTQHAPPPNRSGRPYKSLQLGGPRWAMVGVKIGHKEGHPVSLNVIVTGLDGRPIDLPDLPDHGDGRPYIYEIAEEDDLVERLAEVINRLCALPALRDRYILGIGVEVAGHVFEGEVIEASHNGMLGVALGRQLTRRLDDLADRLHELTGRHDPLPVIVDNDVNVLAVLQTYQPEFPENDLALVAVFDDGIGSALVLGGQVYRGGHGMAGEIAHSIVTGSITAGNTEEPPEPRSATTPAQGALPSFSNKCHCGRDGHLDCYATPIRIMGELGEQDFTEKTFASIAHRPTYANGKLTQEGKVFQHAGQTLGMAITNNLINSINPSRVLLILPPALVEFPPGSAAETYRSSLQDTIQLHAFSDAAKHTQITAQSLSGEQRRFIGALAAAIRVLDSLVQHAKHRCKCYDPKSRSESTHKDTTHPFASNLVGTR